MTMMTMMMMMMMMMTMAPTTPSIDAMSRAETTTLEAKRTTWMNGARTSRGGVNDAVDARRGVDDGARDVD